MTLYEINEAILACIDEETGEVNEELLNELELAKNDKIEAVAKWVKNLKADIIAISAEMKVLSERAEKKAKKIESLENFLAFALNGETFKSGAVEITYRKTPPAVKFVDEATFAEAHPEYIKVKTTASIDRTAIKADIKSGKEIDGVYLDQTINLVIQ